MSNTSRKRTNGTATKRTLNYVNNFICFLFVATAFAMIGIEAGKQPASTHSGTQEFTAK